jgi:hypothetical protein
VAIPGKRPTNPAIVHRVPIDRFVDEPDLAGRYYGIGATHDHATALRVGLSQKRPKQRFGQLWVSDKKQLGDILQASRERHRRLAVLKIRHQLAPQFRVAAKHLLACVTAHRGPPEQRIVDVGAIS